MDKPIDVMSHRRLNSKISVIYFSVLIPMPVIKIPSLQWHCLIDGEQQYPCYYCAKPKKKSQYYNIYLLSYSRRVMLVCSVVNDDLKTYTTVTRS
ncbi:hypothetical protein DAPPUDRAFT_248831 [Daphnia pulex]|uniref:Uncharacterized protein n=1 Tax=Daphnia pulex TaxID=6669 RepID=E9GVB0_DAPPU|nr:hypothetical protein DAPPUDRAFT_248831 [Daphnia pulex]|eukprot:EFX76637.1 hypothetical protein DAPPUDRAFT_248831 [Daphnia pulex]